MLLEKQTAVGDVVTIKFINGEEIIARLESETADTITVNRPLTVSLSPQGLGMIPFLFLGAKETIVLKHQHVIAMCPSKKEAADQYLQGTTGIALA
jgi:hypothetical protein